MRGNRCGGRRRCNLDRRLVLRGDSLGRERRRGIDLRRHLVARLPCRLAALIFLAHTLDLVARQHHRWIGHQDDLRAGSLFDIDHALTLFVEEKRGDFERQPSDDSARLVLHRLFFDDAEDRQREGLRIADVTTTVARGARPQARISERRTQPLARHLQESESRNAPDLNSGSILLQRFAQTVLDLALIPGRGHVDEVDDDQPAHIPQSQLAGNFVGRFEIRIERGLLDVASLGGSRRVHIDAHQRLGVVDHDTAARRQANRVGERGLDLAFDLKSAEQRHLAFVSAHSAGAFRHHLRDEVLRLPIHVLVVDENFADILAEVVADRADDDIAFLIDEKRSDAFFHRRLYRPPQLEQVVEIPLELFRGFPDTGRAHDESHARRNFECAQRLAQLGPVLTFDASRDPARPRVVGHQDQIAPRKARKRGECGALPATLLLLDLNEQLQPFGQGVLDRGRLAALGLLVGVVLACDLLERQEAVPLGAIVDECGFQALFHPCDLRLVDARLALTAPGDFDVEVVQKLAIHHRDPTFFGLGRVDQHSFHCSFRGRTAAGPRYPAPDSTAGRAKNSHGGLRRESRGGTVSLAGRREGPESREAVRCAGSMFAGFVRHGIPADCPDRLVTGNALHRHAPVSVGTGTRLGRRRFEGRVHALVGV